jgi:hypothetical protein
MEKGMISFGELLARERWLKPEAKLVEPLLVNMGIYKPWTP